MTTPRDALRALESKLRSRADAKYGVTELRARARCVEYEVADELVAIVSQMDSEPTVAQWRQAFDDVYYANLLTDDDWTMLERRARELAAKDKQL